MSLSRRRACCSSAPIPVSRESRRLWWPDSATPVRTRSQARALLAGLGVDEISLERSRVGAEQGVGQRAVAPEEPGQVQPDQELHQRVEQPLGGPAAAGGEQRAVSGGVAEEATARCRT